MSKELILKLRYIALCADRADVRETVGQAADALEAKAVPVGDDLGHDTKGSRKALGAMNAKLKAKIGRLERELAAQQPTDWKASGADWCSSIHSNPDAEAWADFFVATFPGLADKHDLMLGWFANAMMAMHDYLKAQQPQSAEAVEWRCRVAGSDHYAHFPTKRCRFCEPLYTTPQPSAGVVTDAARDLLAERQRQTSAEGWTPEHDDKHEWGELAGAAGCYARHVNARSWVYPERPEDYQCEPAPESWPWDAEWWKPSSPRRDLVKAGALILAEIERLDRLNGKEVGRG